MCPYRFSSLEMQRTTTCEKRWKVISFSCPMMWNNNPLWWMDFRERETDKHISYRDAILWFPFVLFSVPIFVGKYSKFCLEFCIILLVINSVEHQLQQLKVTSTSVIKSLNFFPSRFLPFCDVSRTRSKFLLRRQKEKFENEQLIYVLHKVRASFFFNAVANLHFPISFCTSIIMTNKRVRNYGNAQS